MLSYLQNVNYRIESLNSHNSVIYQHIKMKLSEDIENRVLHITLNFRENDG